MSVGAATDVMVAGKPEEDRPAEIVAGVPLSELSPAVAWVRLLKITT